MRKSRLKRKTKKVASAKPVVVVEPPKSPSISRFITEFPPKSLSVLKSWVRLETMRVLVSLVTLLILVLVGIVGTKLYLALKEKQALEKQREVIASEIQYWIGVANTYSNYRDAYFKIATLEYQLGNDDKAKVYVAKALALDPNFEAGRKLEDMLSKKE